jgi:hypothetical protein
MTKTNVKHVIFLVIFYTVCLLPIPNVFAKNIGHEKHPNDNEYFIPFHKNSRTPAKGISTETIYKLKQKISQESLNTVHIVVQVYKDKKSEFKEFCEMRNIRINPLGRNLFNVSLPVELADSIGTESSIRWAGLLECEEKIHKNILDGNIGNWCKVGEDKVKVVVYFQDDINKRLLRKIIKTYSGEIIRFYEKIQACEAVLQKDLIKLVAEHDYIKYVEEIPAPSESENNGARTTTGTATVNAMPYDLKGNGRTVTVYDTGLVKNDHNDLIGRVTQAETGTVSAHSTHVAGTVGGDGTASGGAYAGMAPLCSIVSYDTTEGNWDIEYGEAINTYNTDIITNSTYAGETSEYTSTCEIIDNYGKDVVITWSAGNARDDETIGDMPSIPDLNYRTITGGGKNAKNVILVGAVNDSDEMTVFSSWGPKGDGTMAPIVVAPGYYITSTSHVSTTAYTTMSGTSMSSPCVAGICALILEQYYRIYGASSNPPLPSTIRAIVANTAKDLGPVGPDYKFGFGRIDAVSCINSVTNNLFNEGSILSDGDESDYLYTVSPGQRYLRVTLAWDDEPGDPSLSEHLINDLDLTIISPSGDEYHPLVLDPANPSAIAVSGVDNRNNIEQAVIAYPENGNWTIRVSGTSVNTTDAQSFSIAFTEGTDPFIISVPGMCATISEALNNTQLGDTISVSPGIYYESNIIVPSGVTLIGADFGLERTIINGINRTTNGITLQNSSSIRNIEIVNFNQGITVETNASCNIKNCIIENNNTGIRALSNSSTTAINNNITGNTTGISYSGTYMQLKNNIIAYNTTSFINSGLNYAEDNYNNFYGNNTNVSGLYSFGSFTIFTDPQFYSYSNDGNYANDDLVIRPDSSCKHAGSPETTFNNPDGSRNDMGCYGGPYGDIFLPLAQVPIGQTLGQGCEYILHDNGSYDPHGRQIVSYSWKLVSAPAASSFTQEDIVNSDTNMASFMPNEIGAYVFSLTITNDLGHESEPAEITFNIRNVNTLTVSPSGNGDYTTIASAVNAAQGGDTILIMPGTYYEYNIIIGKPGLKIIGSGWENTIVDGTRDVNSNSSFIFSPHVNEPYGYNGHYAVIEGMTLRNTSWAVRSMGYRVIIQNNLIEDCTGVGVYQYGSESTSTSITVRNNIIRDIASYGISAANGSCLVYNNIISNCNKGVIVGSNIDKAIVINNILQNITWPVSNYNSASEYAVRFNLMYNVSYSSGYPSDNIFQNPLLQADYTLSTNSPCKDAGCYMEILSDHDGSRNDIGSSGGPAGNFTDNYTDWIEFGADDLEHANDVPVDTQPPIITIFEPLNGTITNENIITVQGSVNELCTVFINGNLVPVSASGIFILQINLNSGINIITVEAVDGSGNRSSISLTVEYIVSDTEEPAPVNLALTCTVIASSTYNSNYSPQCAIDNKFGLWDSNEWASNGEMTPWIRFIWGGPQLMDRIVLYDRSNPVDHIRDAWLYFNYSGRRVKSIHLGMFPYGGSAKEVVFDTVLADEVILVVTDGVGANIGLSEFQAYYDS